jgi:hypothetical protein
LMAVGNCKSIKQNQISIANLEPSNNRKLLLGKSSFFFFFGFIDKHF